MQCLTSNLFSIVQKYYKNKYKKNNYNVAKNEFFFFYCKYTVKQNSRIKINK